MRTAETQAPAGPRSIRTLRPAAMVAGFLAVFWAGLAVAAEDASPLRFIVIGDSPYAAPRSHFDRERLLQRIASSDARFVVHIGDTKAEESPCNQEFDRIAIDFLRKMKKPVILTPGDNDWSDCADPLPRLETVRRTFFGSPPYRTLKGVVSQAQNSDFTDMRENLTWSFGGVRFVTVHVVGRNNFRPLSGFTWDNDNNTLLQKVSRNLFSGTYFERFFRVDPDTYGDMNEFTRRDAANAAWLRRAVETATRKGEIAMVILNHADPMRFQIPHRLRTGFHRYIEALRETARSFNKPILWIHGDNHYFTIDKPFTHPENRRFPLGREIDLTRVIVPGAPMDSFVVVDIDPQSPKIFGISVQFPAEGLADPGEPAE